MFENLFPLNLQLKIFQLEGYEPLRLLRWVFKNFWVRKIDQKKKLVLTNKVRLIGLFYYTSLIAVYILLQFTTKNLVISILVTIIVATQPYFALIISSGFFIPAEYIYKKYIIQKTRNKILSFRKLKIIAITGSYGKSSTKEILYQLLKDKYKVLRTPESYNTVLGISKVVDYELDSSYDIFICEMAAYHTNDIKTLCYMIPPKYGILTGITSQHLERFHSLKNIVKTKFELSEAIKNQKNIVYNLNDIEVSNEIQKRNIQNPFGYFEAKDISFSPGGTMFDLITENKSIKLSTNLFGFSNIENLLGALKMATVLGLDIITLALRIKHLEQIPNRFKITKYGSATLVDNTFSSNEKSFKEMLETAREVKGTKILITPGLVELGNSEREMHQKLGKISQNVFDKIILVGKNSRTMAFLDGLQENVELINDSRKEYFEKINEAKDKYDWVFLENDVTENY